MGNELQVAATICVEWGYELHCLDVDKEDWEAIKSGEEISIAGAGFGYEGEDFSDTWSFSGGIGGELSVSYRGEDEDSEGEGYIGTLDEDMIEVRAT